MLDRSAKNGSLSSPATMSPDKTTLDDLRIDHGEDWISIFAAPLAGHGAEEGEAILP